MHAIKCEFEDQSYPVWIGTECLDDIVEKIRGLGASSYHLVTDRTVAHLYGEEVWQRLSTEAVSRLWIIEEGEKYKTLHTVEHLAQQMVKAGVDRKSIIVSVGGGLVGNVAGLLAALLFRGVGLVHIPTTLIAAADSVASLKQAVNLPTGKNLIGCFHTPSMVLIDICYLRTLPSVQLRSGMFEIIKNALTIATDTIPILNKHLNEHCDYSDEELLAFVKAGLRAKQRIMVGDKLERKEALVFEYGHTIGHAIELLANGGVPHGVAVGMGMLVAAEIAKRLGLLRHSDYEMHNQMLLRNGLVRRLPDGVSVSAVMKKVRMDNKRGYLGGDADQVAMVLLKGIGSPAGLAGKPLVLVDKSLIHQCLEFCLIPCGEVASGEMT